MGSAHNVLRRPQSFEIWTGAGFGRRVVEVHSRAEADQVFEAFERQGKRPAMYVGSLLLRGRA